MVNKEFVTGAIKITFYWNKIISYCGGLVFTGELLHKDASALIITSTNKNLNVKESDRCCNVELNKAEILMGINLILSIVLYVP